MFVHLTSVKCSILLILLYTFNSGCLENQKDTSMMVIVPRHA